MSRISVTCELGEEHADFLEAKLQAAAALVETAPAEISLAIVDGQTMSRLHEQYSGEPGPTDVLTFELGRDAGRVREGEIVVCLPVASAEAARRGHPVEYELMLYAVHGLLHLSGYDDREEAAYARMHDREDEILASIGIGPVFARSRHPPPGLPPPGASEM